MSVKSDKWIRKMAQEHKMIEPFQDSQVRDGVNLQASLFQDLTVDAVAQRLSQLQQASGYRPFSAQRFAGTANQQDSAVFNDHGANADQWVFGIIAFHRGSRRRCRQFIGECRPG